LDEHLRGGGPAQPIAGATVWSIQRSRPRPARAHERVLLADIFPTPTVPSLL